MHFPTTHPCTKYAATSFFEVMETHNPAETLVWPHDQPQGRMVPRLTCGQNEPAPLHQISLLEAGISGPTKSTPTPLKG